LTPGFIQNKGEIDGLGFFSVNFDHCDFLKVFARWECVHIVEGRYGMTSEFSVAADLPHMTSSGCVCSVAETASCRLPYHFNRSDLFTHREFAPAE
jgi:hypothetical protein